MAKHELVQDSFQRVGLAYGYANVNAQFHPFKEFKTTWSRCGSQAEFKVTDYLANGEEEVLQDFAHCLFRRIQNKRKEVYSDRLKGWLQSAEFLERNRPLYLARSRNLRLDSRGNAYDLDELLGSLRSKGLVTDGHMAYLSWTDRPNRFRMGYCSVLMKVVAISSALDSESVPDFVAEYVLYHEMLHLQNGLASLCSHHDADFRRQERRYPRWKEAESWLKKVASVR
jgi:hypothetical protein